MKERIRQNKIVIIQLIIYWLICVVVIAICGKYVNLVNHGEQMCLKDFIIHINFKVFPLCIVPIMLFAVIQYCNTQNDINKIVRYKSMRLFYRKVIIGIGRLVVYFAGIVMFSTIVVGYIICDYKIDNWNQPQSYAVEKYGTMLVNTSLFELMAVMTTSVFYCGVILGLVYLIIYRYFNTVILGFISGMMIVCIELVGTGNGLLIGKTILRKSVYIHGVDLFGSMVYPLFAIAVLLVGVYFMGRGDFLNKK